MPHQTLYKNIKQIGPGSYLQVKLAEGKCEISHINGYNPPEPDENNNNIAELSARTLGFLDKSVDVLKSCENRTTVLFSGGLDSSILFKLCQNKYQINTTFSTGYPFEDPNNNLEKDYALSAADAFGTKHKYYQVTTKEYLRAFLESIQIAEEPLNHLQSPLLYLLFKGGLPQDKDLVVSGLGADDIFGIALHSSVFNREKKSKKTIFKLLARQPLRKLLELISRTTGRGQGFLNYLEELPISDAENIIWSLGAYGSEDWVCRYFNVTKQDIIRGRYDYIKQFENRSIYDVISLLAFLGSCSFTQSIWGKLGESQHRTLYYPFCDMNMQNYIYSIPWEVKLESPKSILRNVARQLNVPDFIISRPKSAFGVEAEFWSGRRGAFEPLVPLASKVFDEGQIRNMQSPGPKNPMTFWNILNYSIWKRLCINKEPLTTLLEELQESNSNQDKNAPAARNNYTTKVAL
jgi:asparagine synthetase B (glutamine-hydrolysing)